MAVRGKHHGRPGTPELAVTAKDQTLILEVTVPDHGSSNLTGIEYSYKETTGGAYTSWAPVTGTVTNSGGTFEIGGLDNGTEYTAQVQTVNDIGTSDPSNEEKATPDAPPAITSVAITSDPGADKTYAIDDDIVVTFTFDKNIELSGMGISPYIYLFIGPGEEVAPSCAVGTAPTMVMTCTHTVVENEEDTDGIAVDTELVDAGMKIVGPLGQFADTSHNGLPADSDHLVDGVRPELTGARASADKTKITLTFSEAIASVDRTKITFDSSGTTPEHHGGLHDWLRGGDHPHHGAHSLGHQRDRCAGRRRGHRRGRQRQRRPAGHVGETCRRDMVGDAHGQGPGLQLPGMQHPGSQ